VNERGVVATKIRAQLAQCLNKGQALNIAHRTAHFDEHDLSSCGLGNQVDAAFDLIGDMGDDLNGTAQKSPRRSALITSAYT
jgi:hypothetical protein